LSYSLTAIGSGVSRQAVHAWCKRHQKEPNEYYRPQINVPKSVCPNKTLSAFQQFVLSAVHQFDFKHWSNIAKKKHRRHFTNADFEFVWQLFTKAELQIKALGEQEQLQYLDFLNLVARIPLPQTPHEMREWILKASANQPKISVRQSSVVYAIQAETGRIKIGITSGPIKKRMMALQSASPVALKLLLVKPCNNAEVAEKKIHQTLHLYRSHGEWFDVSESQAVTTVERLCDELFN
jgi:hypothetical protein